MIKVFYGNDPWLIDFRFKAEIKGIEEYAISYYEAWDEDIDFSSSFLFDKVAHVFRCALPSKSKILKNLISSGEDVLIIFLPGATIDKRLSIVKELDKADCLIDCKKIAVDRVKRFVDNVATKPFDNECKSHLINRLGYYEDDTVNLYTVEIAVKRLCFSDCPISVSLIDKEIPENITSKVYVLFDLLVKRDMDRYFLVYDEISKEENTISILSVLLRTARIGFKATMFDAKEIGVMPMALSVTKGLSKEVCFNLINIFQEGVNEVKGGVADKEAFIRASMSAYDVIGGA